MTQSGREDLSVEFLRPAPALIELVSGYRIYCGGPHDAPPREDLFLPGSAKICLNLADNVWQCGFVGSALRPVPPLSVFGPSSQGIYSQSRGALIVAIDVRPRGWHRLFASPADQVADAIEPLSRRLTHSPTDVLSRAQADPSPCAIKALLDDWLQSSLRPPSRMDGRVSGLYRWLTTANNVDLLAAQQALGLSGSQLRRVARSHFGFAPKLLLRRARFLRSIRQIVSHPDRNWSEAIDPSYFDYAHFVRDCHLFLGMAPRQFLALDGRLTRLSFAPDAEAMAASSAMPPGAPLPRAGD